MTNNRTNRNVPSPKFTRTPSIPANGSVLIDPDQNSSPAKYSPFDAFQITNSTNQDIEIQFNDQNDNFYFLESNAIAQEEYPDIQEFHKLRIVNKGSSRISSGDLTVNFYYSGTDADKQAVKQAQKSPVKKFVENVTGFPVE